MLPFAMIAATLAAPVAWDRLATGERDLDGDRRPDRFTFTQDGGSGFWGTTLEVTLADGRAFTVSSFTSHGSRPESWPLPVADPPALLAGLADLIFPDVPWEAPASAAFSWALEVMLRPAGPPAGSFEATGAWAPRWEPGPPRAVQPAVLLVSDPAALHAPDAGDSTEITASRGLLLLRAWGLDELRPGPTCGPWALSVGGHGVAVRDTAADRSTWAWIGGVPPRHTLQKLRWDSVASASCAVVGERLLVLVEGTGPEAPPAVLTDPVLGRYGLLPAGARLEADGLHVEGRILPLVEVARVLASGG